MVLLRKVCATVHELVRQGLDSYQHSAIYHQIITPSRCVYSNLYTRAYDLTSTHGSLLRQCRSLLQILLEMVGYRYQPTAVINNRYEDG